MPIHKCTFLKAIVGKENPKGFKVWEPTTEEFQQFLNHIGYYQEYKVKEFKKSFVSGLWTILMHFLIRRYLESMEVRTPSARTGCM